MSETEKRLAAAKRKFEKRVEERAFSNRSEDVRCWEPEPTKQTVAAWRPKETPSMYQTVRTLLGNENALPVSERSRFRTYT